MLTKQPKILIVDDEPMLLFSLSAFLKMKSSPYSVLKQENVHLSSSLKMR